MELIHYKAAFKEYSSNKLTQVEQRDSLLAHILARLDTDALTALENHPEFSATAHLKDTFHIWELVRHTNLLDSSANTKHHQLVEFTTLKQTGHFGSYLTTFNRCSGLVTAGYESKLHPGYILIDDLYRSIFLQGLTPFYYARIEKLLEEKPNITLSESLFDIQQFTTRNEHLLPASSASFVGKALAATADPDVSALTAAAATSKSYPKPAVGPYDPHSGYCSHCWTELKFAFKHALADCYRKHPNLVFLS